MKLGIQIVAMGVMQVHFEIWRFEDHPTLRVRWKKGKWRNLFRRAKKFRYQGRHLHHRTPSLSVAISILLARALLRDKSFQLRFLLFAELQKFVHLGWG